MPPAPAAGGLLTAVLCLVLGLQLGANQAQASVPQPGLIGGIDPGLVTTGILYDRVLPLSGIGRYDGAEPSEPITLARWKQIYYEMYRASLRRPAWPELDQVILSAGERARQRVVPVAFMNFQFECIRPEALDDGKLVVGDGHLTAGGNPLVRQQVFAVSALKDHSYRGSRVVFEFDSTMYFSNTPRSLDEMDIDFDDGLGFRCAGWGRYAVSYSSAGLKTVRIRQVDRGGAVLCGAFRFHVISLETPEPDDTLAVTASVAYQGQVGTGEAYVYLADGHASIEDPVIVVEGFDLDNSMDWEELYHLLNREGLVETLRTDGFDAVVLNFTEATDYIQRNAFVLVELIDQVQDAVPPGVDMAVVGASMGGLVGRYALTYMEANAMEHRVRTFISFDSPQTGANIPLGIQYWTLFFASQSEDAAFFLDRLNTPAARQLLAYHLTDPPGSTGEPDPLRGVLMSELAALGDYPTELRKVAVANGSGSMIGQGFAPGDQIILYEYNSFLVDIVGNVWAVPDGSNHIIFDGLIDLIWPLPDDDLTVYVSGTRPYDNAPGGWRASMADMDSTQAPYGDIIALHDNHCFIPTVSALALDTDDLFYDIAGDPDLMTHTPFDTVYYPVDNQEHVLITPENAVWFLSEIRRSAGSVVAGGESEPGRLVLLPNSPNPFTGATRIAYSVPAAQHVRLSIYSVAGREVARLIDSQVDAGWGSVVWHGENSRGRRAAPGVYFCRIKGETAAVTRRIILN